MKKISAYFVLFALALAFSPSVKAQGYTYRMNATTNGTIASLSATMTAITIRDDDSQGAGAPEEGSPARGVDYSITIEGNCTADSHLAVYVSELSVHCLDTIYLYDGPSTSSPLIKKFNNSYGDVHAGDYIYVSASNTSNMMTIRFKTDALTDTSRTRLSCYQNRGDVGKGFILVAQCNKPCEDVIPTILPKFYRTRNNVVYDSSYIREVTVYDTVYINEDNPSLDSIDHIDTIRFMGANLCIGDGVIFQGKGQYSYRYGFYTPSDNTSLFKWNMGNEGDTVVGIGITQVEYNEYQRTGCYDVELRLIDSYGCLNGSYASIKVRTALNPIKTLFSLGDLCNSDSLTVNMGYSGENATLTLRRIVNDSAVSKTFEAVTFIPDGCNCPQGNFFEAPVDFSEFPNNGMITQPTDICSICINMEHTWPSDFYMSIICPINKEAMIKYGNNISCDPQGFLGETNFTNSEPGGSSGDNTNYGWATHDDNGSCTDPWNNPFGIGADYCFSRNEAYTLVTGENAGTVWTPSNVRPAGQFYINEDEGNINVVSSTGVTLPVVPATYVDAAGVSHPFRNAGTTPTLDGSTMRKPSNHEEKTDYYIPWTDFSELVGCPLNGTWKIRIYDTWGGDNGWIFNWSLDICNITMAGDCKYQVGIDSLVWHPDPSPQYHDYDLGHYRGLKINAASPTVSYISSPDTAGTFPVLVKIYDEFGCVWDTNTRINTYWTPMPDLGPDTALCGVDRMLLDAGDRHKNTENFNYIWSPFGQNTDTITTAEGATDEIEYIVRAWNKPEGTVGLTCEARDTIRVDIRRQPMPNFVPTPFTFEGCAPFTLSFDNRSVDAVEHYWVFGDGITSTEASPTHTYDAGLYDLKYYATSADGCIDSIISPQAIAVFDAPHAGFSWTPTYPSVLNPVATFTNLTEPKTSWTKYFWEVQYNLDYPLSVETLTEETPRFDFSQYTEGDPSGNYAVRLIARTDNLAPSGNIIYCRDTAENTILVVNDFLQFPNVVSPNDDGVNDRFVIGNLVNGMGYPINQLDIYNKWGTRVYHRENISNDEDFWDPKDMPTGTYFYRFSAKGYNGNIEHNGSIEVVR